MGHYQLYYDLPPQDFSSCEATLLSKGVRVELSNIEYTEDINSGAILETNCYGALKFAGGDHGFSFHKDGKQCILVLAVKAKGPRRLPVMPLIEKAFPDAKLVDHRRDLLTLLSCPLAALGCLAVIGGLVGFVALAAYGFDQWHRG